MTTWLVKAGEQGVIADLFRTKSKIAIGWAALGDFPPGGDWEVFREHVRVLLPQDYSAQRVGSAAGQLWAFIRDMHIGDFIISPVKQSREVLVGEVTGEYVFDGSFHSHYSRTRAVRWFTPMPWDSIPSTLRSCFSQWLTISRPGVDFSPVIAQAKHRNTAPITLPETGPDETLGTASELRNEDLFEVAEESVRQLLRRMSDDNFQRFVGGIFQALGFTVLFNSAGRGADGGVDIILSRDALGAGERIVVQVKHTGLPVGQPELQQLLGTLRPNEWGLMVSLSGINSNCLRYWRENRDKLLRPMESSDLIQLLQEHYEHLTDEYKALMPLRRTYIPFSPAQD